MSFLSRGFHADKVEEIFRENLVTSHGLFGGDLRAPLGFGLISGAEGDDDAQPQSALLRTAGARRRKASVSPLGHSHH